MTALTSQRLTQVTESSFLKIPLQNTQMAIMRSSMKNRSKISKIVKRARNLQNLVQ